MATADTTTASKATETVTVRLTRGQREQLQQRAKAAGLSESPFARELILRGIASDAAPTEDPRPKPTIPAPSPHESVPAPRRAGESRRLKLVLKTAELCRTDLRRSEELLHELRFDVVTAMRLLILFVANREGGQGTKLDATDLDKLLAEAFPHR